MKIEFVIPGEPRRKERPRSAVIRDGKGNIVTSPNGRVAVRVYTPAKTREREEDIGWICRKAMRGAPPLEGALELHVLSVFKVPESFTIAQRAAALAGDLRPVKRPDFDNTLKLVADALNGIAWADDAQVADGGWSRRYGLVPHVRVAISTIGPEQPGLLAAAASAA